MMRRVLAVLLIVLAVSKSAEAALGGSKTLATWYAYKRDTMIIYLGGAMEVLWGLGLICPAKRTVGDISDVLETKLKTGQAKAEDLFTLQLLSATLSLGCRFEGTMLDAVNAVMREE